MGIYDRITFYSLDYSNQFGPDFDGFERMTESTIQVPVPVAQNSDVALECDVLDANPPPQIKWYDDQGEVQEIRQSNNIRFLDNKRYLFIRRLQPSHLERQYYCSVSNVNLSHEISAPTRYVLVDNLTQGKLRDYKQIGDLRAFVGNESFEFTYVGGVFGDNINGTTNRLFVNISPVEVLGNIGTIDISSTGSFMLKADVNYNGIMTTRNGTLTVNREFVYRLIILILVAIQIVISYFPMQGHKYLRTDTIMVMNPRGSLSLQVLIPSLSL